MGFHHRGGHPEKAAGLEKQILAELEAGNYHTRQEISDMVSEKSRILSWDVISLDASMEKHAGS